MQSIKIFSGGQTGVDRAALDAAIELNIPYGGYLPKGRLAEDGPLSEKYLNMFETSTNYYEERTKKNILHSDATLIFYSGKLTGGTLLTFNYAKQQNKPYLTINLAKLTFEESIANIQIWLKKIHPKILNIAGPRESSSPGIYNQVKEILMMIFSKFNPPLSVTRFHS